MQKRGRTPECVQCEQGGLKCEHRLVKSTSCKACIEAKVACQWLGAEGSERAMKRWRKAEEELPRGKRKKVCMTEESEAGPSKVRGMECEGGVEGGADILREIRDMMRANNR